MQAQIPTGLAGSADGTTVGAQHQPKPTLPPMPHCRQ